MTKHLDPLRAWLSTTQQTVCSCDHCLAVISRSPIENMLENAIAMRWAGTFGAVHREWPILSYRADFYLEFLTVKAIVECDGHDFHERTKEQAAHDRQRDREMSAAGYLVLRFTGSEIWRNPFACADQIASAVMDVDLRSRA